MVHRTLKSKNFLPLACKFINIVLARVSYFTIVLTRDKRTLEKATQIKQAARDQLRDVGGVMDLKKESFLNGISTGILLLALDVTI